MISPNEPSLSAKRCLLQQQLREQRQHIIEEFFSSDEEAQPHFPRSATMRFLSGGVGLKLLTGLAVRQLVVRYPGILANAFTLMRLFKDKDK